MRVGELSPAQLQGRLAAEGIDLRTGGFVCRIRSPLDVVAENLSLLYADFVCEEPRGFADFHVAITPPRGLRRWWRPQVLFRFDDRVPFKPLPAGQAFPMMEWGLNWCISNHAHRYLILHAGVVERAGVALVLPAPPGSGKSTLTAALVVHGWRLLSDELGLVDPVDGRLHPLARPVNLKNNSIGVIRERAPDTVFSAPFHDTSKGTVALMRPPSDSVKRSGEVVRPAWVISVRYEPGAAARLSPVGKGKMFMRVADCAFNYSLLGPDGFGILGAMIDACDCYDLHYSRLDEAIAMLDALEPPSPTGPTAG